MAANLIPPPIISFTRKRLVETNDSSCSYFWKWMTVKRIFLLFDTSWFIFYVVRGVEKSTERVIYSENAPFPSFDWKVHTQEKMKSLLLFYLCTFLFHHKKKRITCAALIDTAGRKHGSQEFRHRRFHCPPPDDWLAETPWSWNCCARMAPEKAHEIWKWISINFLSIQVDFHESIILLCCSYENNSEINLLLLHLIELS